MNSSDKDFRFMATNDLMAELQKETIKLDEECERKVVKMLLKLLEDKNGEVQNLAVKCLGPLVNKVKEGQVEQIVDTLCNNMNSNEEQKRDISSIGLKTVISELTPTSHALVGTISKKITARLTDSVKLASDVTVQLEALDILSDLLNRFGSLLSPYHASIQEALIPQLQSQRLAVRKRSITAISYLLVTSHQTLFNRTIDTLLDQLRVQKKSKSPNVPTIRTNIQCIAAISRQAGHRFGEHLVDVMPLVTSFGDSFNDDELKEYCLQALESFVRKCPKEIKSYIPEICTLCLRYLCYDPNYNYEDDEEGEDEDNMEMDQEDNDTNDSNDEYSDDDDMSWKVRRASAKCIEGIISTRTDMILDFYSDVSPQLIRRFKEREENVKVDIYHAYISLLKQTRAAPLVHISDASESLVSPVSLLQSQVPSIIKALHKQLREKSIKTRSGAFGLLTELIHVLPGSMSNDAATLIPGILYSLSDKNSSSNMKIDALSFLNLFLQKNPPQVFQPHTQILLPTIISSVGDSFYKISSEALLVLTQMIRVIRPTPGQDSFPFSTYIRPIYECTLCKLRAGDIDQEVKERAITCMGQLVATFGDCMKEELAVCLPLLMERLKNEITRFTCVKAVTKIASSSFIINLDPLLPPAFHTLASFLRKNQRPLKLATLTLLEVLSKNYGAYLVEDSIEEILREVPPLINESDLHISQLTLSLLTSLIRSRPEQIQDLPIVPQKILPETLHLVRSPLLQGAALQSVLDFFQVLVSFSFPGLDYVAIVRQLTLPIENPQVASGHPLHKQAYHSTAKCVAAITVTDRDQSYRTVGEYLSRLEGKEGLSESVQIFIFLVIGEIGKSVDLSPISELTPTILASFSSTSEEVKSAASFALGSVSVGNLPSFLPFILAEISAKSNSKNQYLLLHSLKEIISCQSINASMIQLLKPHLTSIWTLLINHSECREEGTRNVVAECLGKLTMMNPVELLPLLQQYLGSPSPLARATIITAMKFTISDQPAPIDPLLRTSIGSFFQPLDDPDINVRRVALVAFNSAAHNKPSLIRDLLHHILPLLYRETKVRVSH